MKSSATLLLAVFVISVSSIPLRPGGVDPKLVPGLGIKAGINPTGTGDCDGAVNGKDGKPIKIPCQCPPDRATFLKALNANVAAGYAVNNTAVKVYFPTDNSTSAVNARFNAYSVTLQNMAGPGKGCPMASTTLQSQKNATDAARSSAGAPPLANVTLSPTAPTPAASGTTSSYAASSSSPASASNPTSSAEPQPPAAPQTSVAPGCTCSASGLAASSSTSSPEAPGPTSPAALASVSSPAALASVSSSAALASVSSPASETSSRLAASGSSSASGPLPSLVPPNLVPDLGFMPGKNPTGTGDCDGAVNGKDGKPIKIPCQCPPDRATFLAALNANVAAGCAVNNTAVKVNFPTDNSSSAVDARFNAYAVTLQNMAGPGKGCPMVSTTLQSQKKIIDAARTTVRGGPSRSKAVASPTTTTSADMGKESSLASPDSSSADLFATGSASAASSMTATSADMGTESSPATPDSSSASSAYFSAASAAASPTTPTPAAPAYSGANFLGAGAAYAAGASPPPSASPTTPTPAAPASSDANFFATGSADAAGASLPPFASPITPTPAAPASSGANFVASGSAAGASPPPSVTSCVSKPVTGS